MVVNQNKYKIIFDTNIIWFDNEDKISSFFNSAIKESVNFIKDNDLNKIVFLAMPEIVVEERKAQVLEQIKVIVKKVEDGLLSLGKFGVKVKDGDYKKDFKKKVVAGMSKTLQESKIEIIKTPKINHRTLIKRAIEKTKPFSGDGDKGFKDTLIWLSLLSDAKKNSDTNYILCTNNSKDFDLDVVKKEFTSISKKDFYIVKDLKDLKQLLDTELSLELKLKELYFAIEEEVKKKIGELMVQFNSKKNKDDEFGWDVVASRVYLPGEDNLNAVGYDFKNIEIKDVNELKDNIFMINATLTVTARNQKMHNSWDFSSRISLIRGGDDETESYLVTIGYHRDTNVIILQSSKKMVKVRYGANAY